MVPYALCLWSVALLKTLIFFNKFGQNGTAANYNQASTAFCNKHFLKQD
jgi:hypothetical protein